MVNTTILIPAREKIEIPVSCVERGRWRYRSPVFEEAGAFGYSNLRRQKTQQVTDSLRFNMGFKADQRAIWEEIDRKQSCMGTSFSTDALHEVYQNYKKELEKFISGLEPVPGQSGIAVFINNRFVCLDIFDSPGTLQKLWVKLLQSYVMEALEAVEGKGSPAEPDLQALLDAVGAAECETYPSVGLGTDLRLSGPGLIGAGLVWENRIRHLYVFENTADNDRGGRMGSPRQRRRNL